MPYFVYTANLLLTRQNSSFLCEVIHLILLLITLEVNEVIYMCYLYAGVAENNLKALFYSTVAG